MKLRIKKDESLLWEYEKRNNQKKKTFIMKMITI